VGGLTPLPEDNDDDFLDPDDEFPDKVEVREDAEEDAPEDTPEDDELMPNESVDDDFKHIKSDVAEEDVVAPKESVAVEGEAEDKEEVRSFEGGLPELSRSSIERSNSSSSPSPGTRISSERAWRNLSRSKMVARDSPPACSLSHPSVTVSCLRKL